MNTQSTCPRDIFALAKLADTSGFRWPLHPLAAARLNRNLISGLVDLIGAIEDTDLRDRLVLAAPPVQIAGFTMGMAWLIAKAADAEGIAFVTGRPSLVESGRIVDGGAIYRQSLARMVGAIGGKWNNPLRRLAHRIVTNGWRALLPADVTVMNHNNLLQAMARSDTARTFCYETPDHLFSRCPARLEDVKPQECDLHLAGQLGQWLRSAVAESLPPGADVDGLVGPFEETTAQWLAVVDWVMDGINPRRVPKQLWTGTGSNMITRMMRARTIAAGGTVVGFEHGGSAHIHHDLRPFELFELAFCDRFVADTPAKSALFSQGVGRALPHQRIAVEPGQATHSSFRWPPAGARSAERTPKKLMYVTTAFVGETQYPLQPLIPDVLYADWQGRLLDGLGNLGFEMLCKQHPEGLLKGEVYRTSDSATYVSGRFGETWDAADAFIFDYPATTALWEAMCTDRPIVFLDFGLAEWNEVVWASFRSRCSIVPVSFDDRNRPVVDFSMIADALAGPLSDDTFAVRYLTGCERT